MHKRDYKSISSATRPVYFHIIESLLNASISTKPNVLCLTMAKISSGRGHLLRFFCVGLGLGFHVGVDQIVDKDEGLY
jgi:hypothetical protein